MSNPVRILGAVLAGGQSRRFGSDKAQALLDGQPLIAHACGALMQWCEKVVVIGRAQPGFDTVPDWPEPGMGPLAGLAGALDFAAAHGFARVLTCGVDAPGLPDDLLNQLGEGPACLADQPVIGIWPVAVGETARAILTGKGRHSMYAMAEACGARQIRLAVPLANINAPGDLAEFQRRDH